MEEYERAFYRRSGVRSHSVIPDAGRFRIIHSSNPILERSLSIARDIIDEPQKRYLDKYYMDVQRDYYPRKNIQIKMIEEYVPLALNFRRGIKRYTTDCRADRLLPPSKLRPIIAKTGIATEIPPYYSQGRRYWRQNDPLHLKCSRSDPYTPNRGSYRPLTSHPWRLEYPFRPYSQQYRTAYIHSPKIRSMYLYPEYFNY